MRLPDNAKLAIELIESKSCEAYLVGGCVRDMVMGKIQNDIDITTNMLPDDIEELFSRYKTITIGKKHGTITVFIDNQPIEITTYRLESGYYDNRHPTNISFTQSLKEDLARRDFTMNALCYNETNGLIDLFSGLEDIKHSCIRAIGEPKIRFREDALRILRAFRFMAQLGFSIEETTKDAIYECRSLLHTISKERVTVELTKLLLVEYPVPALSLMNALCVLSDMIKPLTKIDLTAINNSPNILEIRLALVLTNGGIRTLCFDRKLKARTTLLLTHKEDRLGADKQTIKQLLSQIGYEDFLLLLDYKSALGEDVSLPRSLALQIEENRECYSLKQLAVCGNDLISIGIRQGKRIGELLNFLLDGVINDRVKNKKAELLEYLKYCQ